MQARVQGRPLPNPAWETVRKNRLLRGEAKLAWYYLWGLLGGRPGSLKTSPVDIGADQGGDKRAGLRALNALALGGFIEISDRRDGTWVVYVVEPAELEIARRRSYDPQADLFDDSGGVVGADVVQHPPKQSSESSEKARFNNSCSSKTSGSSQSSLSSGSSESSIPRGSAEVKTIGAQALDRAAARRPGDWDREGEIERISQKIFRGVNDPKLRITPVKRMAAAVADREVGEGELDEAIAEVNRLRRLGQLTMEPYGLFTWHCKKLFKRHKLFWPEKAR